MIDSMLFSTRKGAMQPIVILLLIVGFVIIMGLIIFRLFQSSGGGLFQ